MGTHNMDWKRLLLAGVFCMLFAAYSIPAALNGLPKGSDTYYHMRIARLMLSSGL